ncbi:DUF5058 family protein [Paenarthrobacter ureafaciens]|uniref:DUF5058 family protein n=1 Tax=Paenarthrobacter ureafaciens TaxID=37931 RepID=UPI001A99D408|nr:DUF5058 family protein [Paenarthrobacter ureafaciens]QSZ55697.1 hypothetical protein AYX19_21655 [Paenarthrobacter ureafaciens]
MHASDAPPSESSDILAVAGSPILWGSVVAVFAVIAIQTVIYYQAASRAAPNVGLERKEVTRAFRAGAIASIGPSLAVSLIAITLVSVFGTPGVLQRIGLIGSAAFDVAAAGIVAGTEGTTLGGEGYTQQVFANVLLCIAIAGAGWMLVTLTATPLLKRGQGAVERGKNKALMGLISSAALLGAFICFTYQQAARGFGPLLVLIASGLIMAALLLIAKTFRQHWLREWALGIALVASLAFATSYPLSA